MRERTVQLHHRDNKMFSLMSGILSNLQSLISAHTCDYEWQQVQLTIRRESYVYTARYCW